MDFAEFERRGWSDPAIATSYATGFAFAAEQCVAPLVQAAHVERGAKVLDLCSGHGIVALGAAELGASVTGVDFSPAMITLAQKAAEEWAEDFMRDAPGGPVPDVQFVQGDAMDLDFADDSFDAVVMGFGILHVPDAHTAVAEAWRVLKPGGRFAYSCWHGAEQESALAMVFEAIQTHGDPDITLPAAHPAPFFAQPGNAIPLMRGAGFDDVTMTSVPSFWLCKSADDPLRFFAEGTVRGAGLLQRQPPALYAKIRAAIMGWVERNGVMDPESEAKRIPLPAAIVSGVKPVGDR